MYYANNPKVCQEACVGRSKSFRQYVRKHHVSMIIWEPLVDEYLQCVKELTNEMDKNAVAAVHNNSHCKE